MTDFDPSDPASFTFWTEERLRFNDLDTVGHVNNNAIGVFLENARVTLLFDGGGDLLNSGDAVGQSWVIRKIDIDSIHEIRFPGVVQTGTRIARFGSSSCTVRRDFRRRALLRDGDHDCRLFRRDSTNFSADSRIRSQTASASCSRSEPFGA